MTPNTTMTGSEPHRFPSTDWSSLLALHDPNAPDYRRHLDGLIRRYWKPCYYYIRRSWHRNEEDAKDLTEAVALLKRELIGKGKRVYYDVFRRYYLLPQDFSISTFQPAPLAGAHQRPTYA
ncbi:MAG: hypothetical protein HY716_13785 [Planctomycetes bacterium]|nr:hypothetical protein [Planctomycetota bacterium]